MQYRKWERSYVYLMLIIAMGFSIYFFLPRLTFPETEIVEISSMERQKNLRITGEGVVKLQNALKGSRLTVRFIDRVPDLMIVGRSNEGEIYSLAVFTDRGLIYKGTSVGAAGRSLRGQSLLVYKINREGRQVLGQLQGAPESDWKY